MAEDKKNQDELTGFEHFNDQQILDMVKSIPNPAQDVMSGVLGQTPEERYLQPFYNVAEKLQVLDKPRALLHSAVLGKEGALKEELAQGVNPSASPESSFISKFREISPDQQPIMDPIEKDIEQGQTTRAAIKKWVQNKFPKAYNVGASVVPTDFPASVLDIGASELTEGLLGAGAEMAAIPKRLYGFQIENMAKVLRRSAGESSELANEMARSGKLKEIAMTADKYKMTTKFNDPSEIYKTLAGEQEQKWTSNRTPETVKTEKGLISKVSDQAKGVVDEIKTTNPQAAMFDAKDIADKAFAEIDAKLSKGESGVIYTPADAARVKEKIYGIMGVDSTPNANNLRPLDSLLESKHNVGEYSFDLKRSAPDNTVVGASDKVIYNNVWKSMDNAIKGKLSNFDLGRKFLEVNRDLSDLLGIKTFVENSPSMDLLGAGKMETAIAGGIGAAGAGALGYDPSFGAMIGVGGYHGLKGAFGKNEIPGYIAKAAEFGQEAMGNFGITQYGPNKLPQNALPNTLLNATGQLGVKAAPFLGKSASAKERISRSPQSIPTPLQAQFMGRGLVTNLADYEIPRDTKSILANRQSVLAKVAQVTDNPQIVKGLEDALDKHPDKLETVVQMMSLQFPDLFEADRYNRVNGKIFHPDPMIKAQMIKKAYDDVENKAPTNTEKVMLQNGLNKDGSLPPSFQ